MMVSIRTAPQSSAKTIHIAEPTSLRVDRADTGSRARSDKVGVHVFSVCFMFRILNLLDDGPFSSPLRYERPALLHLHSVKSRAPDARLLQTCEIVDTAPRFEHHPPPKANSGDDHNVAEHDGL